MEDFVKNIAPLVALVLVFGIPIVAILTAHQRRMAELIHGKQAQSQPDPQLLHEVMSMRQELSYLRETVNQQRIEMDDLKSLSTRLESSDRDIMNAGS